MSYDCQQISFDDSFMTLTERKRKSLKKCWVKVFADEIFPAIKELFDYSDDGIVENLMLDLHLQYALHTTYQVKKALAFL